MTDTTTETGIDPRDDGSFGRDGIHRALIGGNDTYSVTTDMIPKQGTPITECPSNIDSRTMRGKALLVKAGSPGELEVTDGAPLRMVATHWLIMPDFRADEKTGEVTEFTRVVLYNAGGQHFRSSSAGGYFSLRRMMQVYTPEEWAAGIPVVVVTRPSKRYRGSSYHDIQVDFSALGLGDSDGQASV